MFSFAAFAFFQGLVDHREDRRGVLEEDGGVDRDDGGGQRGRSFVLFFFAVAAPLPFRLLPLFLGLGLGASPRELLQSLLPHPVVHHLPVDRAVAEPVDPPGHGNEKRGARGRRRSAEVERARFQNLFDLGVGDGEVSHADARDHGGDNAPLIRRSLQALLVGDVPLREGDASSFSCFCSSCCSSSEGGRLREELERGGRGRVADQGCHLVAPPRQLGDDGAAEPSRGPGDEDAGRGQDGGLRRGRRHAFSLCLSLLVGGSRGCRRN